MATISLDFDKTFTADPELWKVVVPLMKNRGHKIYCITARRETFENKQEVYGALDGVIEQKNIYFSYDDPKRWFAERQGLYIDIWIDDAPEAICGVF